MIKIIDKDLVYKRIKNDFPCSECITFPICKNRYLLNVVNRISFKVKRILYKSAVESNKALCNILYHTLLINCNILREHIYRDYPIKSAEEAHSKEGDQYRTEFQSILSKVIKEEFGLRIKET